MPERQHPGFGWRRASPISSMEKTGIVQTFNVSPKGTLEGLLMKMDGEVIQINFRQEFAAEIAAVTTEGKELKADVEPEEAHGHPNHPVFRLLSLGSQHGHFAGKVKHLNYALHGEVNGAILDNGDFLHVKPHVLLLFDGLAKSEVLSFQPFGDLARSEGGSPTACVRGGGPATSIFSESLTP